MEADPFLQRFDSSDLQIAKEFLTNWVPFLTKDLCDGCAASLLHRIQSLSPVDEQNRDIGAGEAGSGFAGGVSTETWEHIKATGWDTDPSTDSPKVRMSWADELEEEEEEEARKNSLEEGMEERRGEMRLKKTGLSREQRERIRFTSLERKKDFVCLERIDGKIVNILEGIELHNGVFSAAEQKRIVDFVYELQVKGRNNELEEHTYSEHSESSKSMLGKGCATIQFGCSFNYMEQNENPLHTADPIPILFKLMIKRLIGWHVMPVSCVPDSCRVNIYDPGFSERPNIESHGFVRPLCTVSFLSECNMMFGFNLKHGDAGEVKGSTSIPLPVGSVLVLNGKGANIAKHWVPAVPSKRISITFRKIDENKRPLGFRLEPDLQNIRPYDLAAESHSAKKENQSFVEIRTMGRGGKKFAGRSNGAKGRRNFVGDGASVFDRITPAKNSSHSSADADFTVNHSRTEERARICADLEGEIPARSRHGRRDEEGGGVHFDRSKFSNERSVRVDQKRIVITRNLEREEDDSFSRGGAEFKAVHPPQVSIRTLKNNLRRVRTTNQ